MLLILQVIALLQGLFLILALLTNRKSYKKPALWLLIGSILSIVFYILGGDEHGFFIHSVDWFFFDSSLFITFLFLFVNYFVSGEAVFKKKHLLYFIPNIAYFIIEVIEEYYSGEKNMIIETTELLVELILLSYVVFTVRAILVSKKQRWMVYFIIPLSLIMVLSLGNEIFGWFGLPNIPYFSDPANNTYTLIIIAFLFYFITWKLAVERSEIVPFSETKKYKTSGLNDELIEVYKNKIIAFMEDENGFMDSELSLPLLAQKLNLPKQYISEILNVYLNTNFQDFVNGYRIEAFSKKLNKPEYANLTLVGIANEVGFSSKSNFYTTFKKFKGLTPSEYRKSISS